MEPFIFLLVIWELENLVAQNVILCWSLAIAARLSGEASRGMLAVAKEYFPVMNQSNNHGHSLRVLGQ